MTTIPTVEEIKEHFKDAKDIKCLNLNSTINITNAKNFSYDEVRKGYFSIGGIVCFWKLDVGYAPILKIKCAEKCVNCKNCKELKTK